MCSTNMYERCTCKAASLLAVDCLYIRGVPAGLLHVLLDSEEQMLQTWAECRNSERD